MKLLLPIIFQAFYAMLKQLILAENIFIAIQRYIVVKKLTKKSKKAILQKAVLIYNKNKIYVSKGRLAKNITLRKYNCLFNVVILTKNNV